MSIHFSAGDIDFSLQNEDTVKKWISDVVISYGSYVGKINYLFCSDSYVHQVNLKFLQHDTYTDIITFDYVEGTRISGDIIISVDRVRENSQSFSVPFQQELHRVIIHGVLHLLGFKDKTDADASVMRLKEDESLALFNSMT